MASGRVVAWGDGMGVFIGVVALEGSIRGRDSDVGLGGQGSWSFLAFSEHHSSVASNVHRIIYV